MADNLGFDGGYDVANVDMLKVDTLVTGNQLVAQRIARMLFTPHGALASIDPDPSAGNWGWDCRQYVNGKLSPAQVSNAKAQIENAILQDEEVEDVEVQFALNQQNGNLAININISTSAGPFLLVIDPALVSAQLVFNSGQQG